MTLFLKIPRVALGFLRNCGLLLFVGLLFPMLTHMLHFYFPPWEARLSFHVRLPLAAFFEFSLFLAQSHIVASHLLPRVERSSFLQPLSLVFTATSMDGASGDECSNSTSGDESSETESNSRHRHGQRVSLGSLCMSSPKGARSTRRHSDAAMTTLVELPNVDGHPGEQIGPTGDGADSPYWFQAGFIPHNEQEVLTWHPNRLRATLAAELHRRVQHMTPRRSRTKTFEPLNALMSIFGKPGGDAYLQSAKVLNSRTSGRDLYFRLLNIITGVKIRELRVTHGDKWMDTSKGDRVEWSVLHCVIHHRKSVPVIRFPNRFRP